MKIVVDANVLIAALIRNSHTRHKLLMSKYALISPAFLLEEINENAKEIARKAGISEQEMMNILHQLLTAANITIIPMTDYKESMPQATQVSPDIDDVPYFALALKLGCAIWSNDKKLKEQSMVQVYTTEELS